MKTKGRVKNATKVDAYGLHFRSKLELYTYEAFMKAGIPVKYEPKHFTLLPKFEFLGEKIRPITYLPDFVGRGFIVECKTKLYLVRNQKQVNEMIEELKKR